MPLLILTFIMIIYILPFIPVMLLSLSVYGSSFSYEITCPQMFRYDFLIISIQDPC
jgi:hypothetical protein